MIHVVGTKDITIKVKELTPEEASAEYYYYLKWKSMLERCYSRAVQKKQPAYIGTTVCKEWHLFSNFRKWMMLQDWQGLTIDKDIIYPTSKVYSPDTCCFVTQRVNNLFVYHTSGELPLGVRKQQSNNNQALISDGSGKRVALGTYSTPLKAHLAYLVAKVEVLEEVLDEEAFTDPRIVNGFKLRIDSINKCLEAKTEWEPF